MDSLRRASLDEKDISSIQRLSNYFHFLYRTAVIDYILKKQVYLYEKEGIAIGMLIFSYNEKYHEHKILNLLINKEFRGLGLGKALFNQFIKDTKPIKIKILATYSPDDSTGFWEKMGFLKVGEPQKTKRDNYLLPMYWLNERLK